VSAGRERARGEVELRLDESGRIACVLAQDRPRKEGSGFVERPWRGRFFDHRKHQDRWPFAGEVGWILDGQTFIAAYRMRKECGPIRDPELRASCVGSFSAYEPR
jgi:hypothetical protein